MKKMIVVLVLILLILANGCIRKEPFEADVFEETAGEYASCKEYCESQPQLVACMGYWKSSGIYPDCKCRFVCEPVSSDDFEETGEAAGAPEEAIGEVPELVEEAQEIGEVSEEAVEAEQQAKEVPGEIVKEVPEHFPEHKSCQELCNQRTPTESCPGSWKAWTENDECKCEWICAETRFMAPSGDCQTLAFDGTYMWSAGEQVRKIYKHKVDEGSLTVVNAYDLPGGQAIVLEFDGQYLWSLTGTDWSSGAKTIIKKHVMDGDLTVFETKTLDFLVDALAFDGEFFWTETHGGESKLLKYDENFNLLDEYPAPAPKVKGIAFDGDYLWTSEYEKMYKHLLDDELTVGKTYDTGYNGLEWDGESLWGCGGGNIQKLTQGFLEEHVVD